MQNVARLLFQNRTTPISRAGMIVTFSLAAAALTTAMAKKLEFVALPNLIPLITAVFIVDVLCQLAPQTSLVRAVQTVLYSLLYLVITCFCGVLAAYSTQRFAFPLRDQFLASADHLAFGVNWTDIVHWVDDLQSSTPC
jgi:ABC-type glycerol-3-phosphate transport system permease component